MYEIIIVPIAKKQIDKLPKETKERILSALERIRVRPHAFVEKLVNEQGYKFRVGDYRILLDIIERELVILVVKVGHRRNIYKKK
ncbi:cytotoxic translational repressor of toxin-antitoxin stability system [Candidatus Woesearchaeota archaeon]|nr:cytotoxic translational repressor of toxin-antitoxin stability system [Candidatus Woesearchaeota archaeon]|tara:strand:+ start:464 stop:718 length:255 start_codon:yes stop_codon:yes gene_type:complete